MRRPAQPSLNHLSSDPVSGVPHYCDSSDGHSSYLNSTLSTNPPVAELPSNMLGARARAAEYNAARAATARQQARKESDEVRLPPGPTPVSLSAFTRNASYSRNRGAKSFVPLILSEEEEKSASGTDPASETDPRASPCPDPVARAASLPPPQTLPTTKAEMDNSVQTPFRYRSPRTQNQLYPHMVRSIYPEDGFGLSTPGIPVHPQQHLPYHQIQPLSSHLALMPAPQVGWYSLPDYHDTQYSYYHAGIDPVARFAVPGPQPHRHNLSQESSAVTEPAKRSSSPEPAPDSTQPTTPLARLGGPTLHVFGPDDLSPTKIEVKQRAREEYLAKHGSLFPSPTIATTFRNASTPKQIETDCTHRSTRSTQIHAVDIRKSADSFCDLLIDRDSIAPVRVRGSTVSTTPFHGTVDVVDHDQIELLNKVNAKWSALGQTRHRHQVACVLHGSPTRQTRESKSDHAAGIMMKPKGRTYDTWLVNVRSMHEMDGSRPKAVLNEFESQKSEHMTDVQFPLIDVTASDWCTFRGPTEEDQQRTIAAARAIESSLISTSGHPELLNVKHEDFQGPFQGRIAEYERRKQRIQNLANEMEHKWRRGGQSRKYTISEEEAKSQAGKIKAIGHMLAMLSIQAGTNNDLHYLGSRSYVQPPEYAIERGVGIDREGLTSLFEPEGDEGRSAPPRLARDPRFRAQINEGAKIRVDEERIPRMFVARSRSQV